MNAIQIVLALMVLVLWLWLLNDWHLRNWRASSLGGAGTLVILAAGVLPNPARGLIQAGAWGGVVWIFVIRPELVGVMAPEEYRYVDEHVRLLRRIAKRKHSRGTPEPGSIVRAFEADLYAMDALTAPSAWSHVHERTIRELSRRLTMMKLGTIGSPGDQRAMDARWQEIGNEFRAVLKARAGFWTGWPRLIQLEGSRRQRSREWEFHGRLFALTEEARQAADRSGSDESKASDLADIVARMRALQAPNRDWADLRDGWVSMWERYQMSRAEPSEASTREEYLALNESLIERTKVLSARYGSDAVRIGKGS